MYGTSNPHDEARQHFAAIDASHAAQSSSGHVDGSGLQKHSIGETYPFTVVGTMLKDSKGILRTYYYVKNLETGETFYRFDSQYYRTSASAHGLAQFLKFQSEGEA